MYPAKFDYQRPSSVEEAVALLAANEDAKLLAGGHSLIPVMKLRLSQPEMLIDIGRIPGLNTVAFDGKTLTIGALTTHAQIEQHGIGGAIEEAAGMIGDPAVRNRGTIGGNIAHADPASDWPTVLVAFNAQIQMAGPEGSRIVDAADFFTGLFETALAEQEMITHVLIPAHRAGSGSAYEKLFNPASRYAMIGCCVQVLGGYNDTPILDATVAIGGLTPNARRCLSVEGALKRGASAAEAAQAVLDDLAAADVLGDIHASAEYRRAVAPAIMQRAIEKALSRAS